MEHVCNRIAVMYLGQIVEIDDADDLLRHPAHPYTEALVSAVPAADPDVRMQEDHPERGRAQSCGLPAGCVFHPRCRYAEDICQEERSELEDLGEGHLCRCHFAKELDLMGIA